MKCPMCSKDLISNPDAIYICPTTIEGRLDSHYRIQSKLTWQVEVFIIPPFWFQNHSHEGEPNDKTYIFKYPYRANMPQNIITSVPPWESMIMKWSRIYPKDIDDKLINRIKLLTVFS